SSTAMRWNGIASDEANVAVPESVCAPIPPFICCTESSRSTLRPSAIRTQERVRKTLVPRGRAQLHSMKGMVMTKQSLLTALALVAGVLGTGATLLVGTASVRGEPTPAKKQASQKLAPPFSVPPGFVIERVAGPPLVERPMMAGFDDRGRLFVCDSSGF